MTTGKKVFGGVTLLGLWCLWSLRPQIKVTALNPNTGAVTFTMSIDGYSITDTCYPADIKQIIPAGDGKHFFISEGQQGGDDMGAYLAIGERNAAGTLNEIAAGYISAFFPANQLPTKLN